MNILKLFKSSFENKNIIFIFFNLLILFSAHGQTINSRSIVVKNENQLIIGNRDLLIYYSKEQKSDGSFLKPIHTSSVIYNTQILYLYAFLDIKTEKSKIISKLFSYIWDQQNSNGSFSAYPGDGGSSDVSLMVYLVSKLYKINSEPLNKLESILKKTRKLRKSSLLSTPYLMLSGIDRRVNCIAPVGLKRLLKLDGKIPWIRVLLYPMLFLYQTDSQLEVENYSLKGKVGCVNFGFRKNHYKKSNGKSLIDWFSKYKENNSLIFSYVPTTIPWIMAIHQLKNLDSALYEKINGDQIIQESLNSIENFQVSINSEMLYQSPGEGSVAETIEVAKLFLDAGIDTNHPIISQSINYLLSIQQANGGFGFSKFNQHFADPDDTSLVVSLFDQVNQKSPSKILELATGRALNYIQSRNNNDGGFGAWEREQDIVWWFRPLENRLKKSGLVLTESTSDVTSRVVMGLKNHLSLNNSIFKKWKDGILWLMNHQNKDGSFLSTWMVGYGFGTATALASFGTAFQFPSQEIDQEKLYKKTMKSINFLKSLQKNDGSFSEDLTTYLENKSVISENSSPAMTGIVLSRILLFLEIAPQFKDDLKDLTTNAYHYLIKSLHKNGTFNDETWTAISFPKIEYAKYYYIHEVEVFRSIVLYEKLFLMEQ